MKHPNNFRNVSDKPSPYFQGYHRGYGRYQWCIKYYGFQSEFEVDAALRWCFGEYIKVGIKPLNGNAMRGFEYFTEMLGRPIESRIDGRSGGWLVIDTELTDEELKKVDEHVEACLKALPEFLKEERTFHADGAE